jgi:hypothetical protein
VTMHLTCREKKGIEFLVENIQKESFFRNIFFKESNINPVYGSRVEMNMWTEHSCVRMLVIEGV